LINVKKGKRGTLFYLHKNHPALKNRAGIGGGGYSGSQSAAASSGGTFSIGCFFQIVSPSFCGGK